MKYCYNEATTPQKFHARAGYRAGGKSPGSSIELWLCQIEQYLETHSIKKLQGLLMEERSEPFAFDSFEDILFSAGL